MTNIAKTIGYIVLTLFVIIIPFIYGMLLTILFQNLEYYNNGDHPIVPLSLIIFTIATIIEVFIIYGFLRRNYDD